MWLIADIKLFFIRMQCIGLQFPRDPRLAAGVLGATAYGVYPRQDPPPRRLQRERVS